MFSGDPIPEKSDQLFHVTVDSWDPDSNWDSDRPELQPNQLTYTDMRGLMQSDIPTYQTGSYKASMTVQPEGKSDAEKPFREVVRMCFGDFFLLFDVPFQYGSGWDAKADASPEPVVVIDAETNRKMFGGENSVGKSIRIDNRDFTIVGVMAEWRPLIHFYDVNNNPFEEPGSDLHAAQLCRALRDPHLRQHQRLEVLSRQRVPGSPAVGKYVATALGSARHPTAAGPISELCRRLHPRAAQVRSLSAALEQQDLAGHGVARAGTGDARPGQGDADHRRPLPGGLLGQLDRHSAR